MHGDEAEITNLAPRFWVCCLFAMPIWARVSDPGLQWIFATIVMVIGGWLFLKIGFSNICNRFTLIALGIAVAYLYSSLALIIGERPRLYFKPLVSIIPMLLLWLQMEQGLIKKALEPLQQFFDFFPKKASKMFPDGHFEVVTVDRLAQGDFVRLQPGQLVPVDGMVFSNSAEINEAILSPTDAPQKKRFGESVIGGWKNGKELSIVQATAVGKDTIVAKLQAAATESLSSFIKEYNCAVLIAIVLLLAFFSFLIWTLTSDFEVAIGVFCAICMATPAGALTLSRSLVLKRAIGIGARHGIVFNAKQLFEQRHKVDSQSGVLQELKRSSARIGSQSVFLAVFSSAILIPLAMFGVISMIPATLGMIAASLCVAGNALRLK